MSGLIINITWWHLSISLVPVIPVVWILFHWNLKWRQACYAIVRMLAQLMLIGYVLAFIFEAKNALIIMGVLGFMLVVASWISMGSVPELRRRLYPWVFIALLVSCGLMIILVTQGTLGADPWYDPRVVLPLSGMIMANSMNSVSIAAERVTSELKTDPDYVAARGKALQAALIPVINGLFAVGLVSLPGMMTGQILSGVSPLIAAKYQIIVMCMLFSSAGMSSAGFLWLARDSLEAAREVQT